MLIKEKDKIISLLNKIQNLFISNNHLNEAKEVLEFKIKIENSRIKKNMLMELSQRCHLRWYGDLYIKEFQNINEWYNLLNEVVFLIEEQESR